MTTLAVPLPVMLAIAERDGWRCQICGQGYRPGDPWEADHDTSRVKGGTHLVSNLRLSHRRCNREKADA